MFCPNCGTQVTESLKFCKQCGANLLGVRDAMTRGGGNFDWGKTWVAEMLLSEDERERKRGVTLEEKRYNEIKAGVITAVAGLGGMLFFLLFMPAVAQNEPQDAHVLTRLWVIGLIPLLIGLSIIFNGVFLSKKIIEVRNKQMKGVPDTGDLNEPYPVMSLSDNTSTPGPAFSVIETTTRPIPDAVEARGRKESN